MYEARDCWVASSSEPLDWLKLCTFHSPNKIYDNFDLPEDKRRRNRRRSDFSDNMRNLCSPTLRVESPWDSSAQRSRAFSSARSFPVVSWHTTGKLQLRHFYFIQSHQQIHACEFIRVKIIEKSLIEKLLSFHEHNLRELLLCIWEEHNPHSYELFWDKGDGKFPFIVIAFYHSISKVSLFHSLAILSPPPKKVDRKLVIERWNVARSFNYNSKLIQMRMIKGETGVRLHNCASLRTHQEIYVFEVENQRVFGCAHNFKTSESTHTYDNQIDLRWISLARWITDK